jgi:hypothetical protein
MVRGLRQTDLEAVMTAHPNQVSASIFWIGESWTARGVLTAAAVLPITYSLALPFLLLDVWVQLYQAAAFRLLGISRVRRRDYIVIDRHRLPYLTTIQKANCVYCGYINGVLAFVREVAGRTEQFWCPIRHARRARGQHRRHRRFAPYGDGDAFHRVGPALRAELLAAGKQPRRRRT